jgi:transposase
VLTGGLTNDCTQAIALLGDRRPEAVLADKGYDTDVILNHLGEHGIAAAIPPRSIRKVQRSFERTLYRQRNRIKRTFAHLKQFRRLRSDNMSIHPSRREQRGELRENARFAGTRWNVGQLESSDESRVSSLAASTIAQGR